MEFKIEFKNIYSAKDYLDKVYNIISDDCTEVIILGERYNTLKDYLDNVYKSFCDKNVIIYYNISIHNEGYMSWCNEKGVCCSAKVSLLPPRENSRGKLSNPLEWTFYTKYDY